MSNKKIVNKRRESTKKYIDKLQDRYSKLNIIRVDLGYKKPYSDNIKLDEGNDDFNRMLNNRRGKPSVFKNQVGYVCKKEYTKDKGIHFHALFIFDGNKVQKDSYMGDNIGKYWNEQTKGKGSYHNCNRNKYKVNGLGLLDHKDKEKREVLDNNVISYLCKDDENQDISSVKNNKDRAFVRGTIPRKKTKVGRPRNKIYILLKN